MPERAPSPNKADKNTPLVGYIDGYFLLRPYENYGEVVSLLE